tara:strand:+ start:40 stop:309 length:270 start_codon:yes stop_codon:yes gene_type:complete
MSEENKDSSIHIEYKFVDQQFKQNYVLQRIADLEREHFGLMVDKLDESHTDYATWYEACQEVVIEINRLKYIYEKLGGSFGSIIPGMDN